MVHRSAERPKTNALKHTQSRPSEMVKTLYAQQEKPIAQWPKLN
jgi:hypothetical protein